MSQLQNFEFISRIPPNETSARAIQFLTLQDIVAGGFENPTHLADPDDPVKVSRQLARLSQFPEQYSAYNNEEGILIAYMRSNEWFVGDEAPFIAGLSRRALLLASRLRGASLRPEEYGVFGLVASNSLGPNEHYKILHNLLSLSIEKAASQSTAAVNIVLHDRDPVVPVARDLGFRPSGASGVAAGAPGLVQRRYRVSIE